MGFYHSSSLKSVFSIFAQVSSSNFRSIPSEFSRTDFSCCLSTTHQFSKSLFTKTKYFLLLPLQTWGNHWALEELQAVHCVILLWPSFLGKVTLKIWSLLPQMFLWDCLKLDLCLQRIVSYLCFPEWIQQILPSSFLYLKWFIEIVDLILYLAGPKYFIIFSFLTVSKKLNLHFLYFFINLTKHFSFIFLLFLMFLADV